MLATAVRSTLMAAADHPRSIRSFVTRSGRITEAQQRALAELWPKYGIAFSGQPLDADALYILPAAVSHREADSVPVVLTPHHGELAALAGVPLPVLMKDIRGFAEKVARRFNAVVGDRSNND